jgi:hypothetical protein
MKTNNLIALYLVALLFSSINVNAEEYYTGGGYDPVAAEKAEKEAKARQAIEDEKQNKIERKKAAAEKQRRDKIASDKKAEKLRKELLPENLATLKEHELCIKAGKHSNNDGFKNIISELKRRSTSYDELSIRNKQIKINGFECDVFAAYGLPQRYNRRVSARGTSVQFVYNRTYVYTDNGIITSWSD